VLRQARWQYEVGADNDYGRKAMTDKAQGAATERELFEKAMSDLGQAVNYQGDGWYASRGVRLAWDAWQLRAALKAQPTPTEAPRPDLSKFVTVEQWQAAMSQWSLNKALGKGSTEAQGEPTAEQYSQMLRALCCQYGVGGYNSDGLINPDVAGEKLAAALDEQFRVGGEMALKKAQGEDSARLEWISVADQLPAIGQEVIVHVPGSDRRPVTALMRLIAWEGSPDFYWDNAYPGKGNMHIGKSVTHWAVMPAAPQPQEQS
jgi:hypothetical protein